MTTSTKRKKSEEAADAGAVSEPSVRGEQKASNGPELSRLVEAALIGSDRAVPGVKLAEAIAGAGVAASAAVTTKAIKDAVAELNGEYEAGGHSFRIEQVAGGYQIMTISSCAPVVAALNKAKAATKLGPAAMETLAIIAYKQPVLRADVEAIRGVACGEVIRALMEKRLVKIAGRAEELGRPILYGTTKIFLEVFGMANLKDLPQIAAPPPPLSPPKPEAEAKPGITAGGKPGAARAEERDAAGAVVEAAGDSEGSV